MALDLHFANSLTPHMPQTTSLPPNGLSPNRLSQVAVGLINKYQRYLSPHKGYSCAHRTLHGGDSCSQHAKTQIVRVGIWRAIPLMRQRFRLCAQASQSLRNLLNRLHEIANLPPSNLPPLQSIDDLGDCIGDACDVLDIAECCCSVRDLFDRRKRK